MKRKLLTIFICCLAALTLAFSLVSCGNNNDNKETQNTEGTESGKSTENGEPDKKSECELNGHTPNADDGDCTTAVTCSVCGVVTAEAKNEHTGGTATCVSGKLCDVCGYEYSAEAPENHAFDAVEGKCTLCNEPISIDATEMTVEELNKAVSIRLSASLTDIEITLAPNAPAKMFTAIRRALIDTEGVESPHLTSAPCVIPSQRLALRFL